MSSSMCVYVTKMYIDGGSSPPDGGEGHAARCRIPRRLDIPLPAFRLPMILSMRPDIVYPRPRPHTYVCWVDATTTCSKG